MGIINVIYYIPRIINYQLKLQKQSEIYYISYFIQPPVKQIIKVDELIIVVSLRKHCLGGVAKTPRSYVFYIKKGL